MINRDNCKRNLSFNIKNRENFVIKFLKQKYCRIQSLQSDLTLKNILTDSEPSWVVQNQSEYLLYNFKIIVIGRCHVCSI